MQFEQQKKLKEFIKRVETIEGERTMLAEDIKAIKEAVKAEGFDVPAFNAVLARRKKDRAELEKHDDLVETYEGYAD